MADPISDDAFARPVRQHATAHAAARESQALQQAGITPLFPRRGRRRFLPVGDLLVPALWAALGCLLHGAAAAQQAGNAPAQPRETVLDGKVHIEEEIVREIPDVPPLCNAIADLTRRREDVGNGTLYCEEEGQGVPLVLVSGGPGCTHHLFHPHFSRAKAFSRIFYYDQRGTGQSDADETGATYNLKQAVDDLDHLRKALSVDHWVVLGHSYGGLLAQCYALEYPDSVLGLILVAASPGMPAAGFGASRQQAFVSMQEAARIRAIQQMQGLPDDVRLYNIHLNGDWKRQNFYRPTTEELARMARYEWKPAPGFRRTIGPDLERIDLTGKFADFDIPTLLVEAKWDLTWAPGKPETFQGNHPKARLVVFEKSGHSPFADEPERFFALIRDFISAAQEGSKTPRRRPSSRVAWPSPLSREVQQLKWTGSGAKAVELAAQARKADLADGSAWFKLGLCLYDGGHYEEGLDAFRRTEQLAGKDPSLRPFGWAAVVWQGHLLDLLGRRPEAVARYQAALDAGPGAMRHDQYGIVLDRTWIEERIRNPFERANRPR
jgi:proline iminopeptidase